jgi:hypothetical protein
VRCQRVPFQRAAATLPPGAADVVPTAMQLSALTQDIAGRRAGGDTGAVPVVDVTVLLVAAWAGPVAMAVAAATAATAVRVPTAAVLAVARNEHAQRELLNVIPLGIPITDCNRR